MLRHLRYFAFFAAFCLSAQAQPEPAPAGVVTGVGGFSHIVANVEKSIAFYRDVLGLELTAPPRPFASTPWIMKMGNTPGAQSRPAILRIPGAALRIELIDYKDVDRKPAHPRFQDPGAANLILTVRDIDPIMAKVKATGAHVVTKGGEPSVLPGPGKARVVFLQDPDGFLVELSERHPTPETTAPASSNVIGGAFEIVVSDLDAGLILYRDVLGFHPQPPTQFNGNQLMMDTAGTPGAQFRRTAAQIPGTSVMMAFMEFKDIDRKPLHTRVQDPGTPILQVRVADVEAVTKAWKAAGGEVISEGGQPVEGPNGTRFCIVRDPNNLFLELFQAPPRPQSAN